MIESTEYYDWIIEEEHGKKVWYVIKKPNTVIATCYVQNHAIKISTLLNFLKFKKNEKKILSELLVK